MVKLVKNTFPINENKNKIPTTIFILNYHMYIKLRFNESKDNNNNITYSIIPKSQT